jgi:hypothetical protein
LVSCPDHNAFHPRKGKPPERVGRKATDRWGETSVVAALPKGRTRGEQPVRPATYGDRPSYEVVLIRGQKQFRYAPDRSATFLMDQEQQLFARRPNK